MKPTDKQISFIKDICGKLNLKEPDCKTVREASFWIQSHLDAYNEANRSDWTEHWDEEDYELHGYSRDDYH